MAIIIRGVLAILILGKSSDTCISMRENGAYQGVKYNSFMEQDTVLAKDISTHTSERN